MDRNKIRHFNDLKDATNRRKDMESSDEEVLAKMESKTQSSGHEGRKQKLTEERGNRKNQKTDNPKKSQNGESRCQSDKPGSVQQRRGYS